MSRKSRIDINRHGILARNVEIIELKARFLIVCEGSKTEPGYFQCFQVAATIIKVVGEGMNTVSLVDRAIELKHENQYTEDTDQVWCVFDKDSFSSELFNNAITKAQANGLRVAYSNEAFELWYLLHYDYHTSALHRS